VTGYRFDTDDPEIGGVHSAFQDLDSCREFMEDQGPDEAGMAIYEITGELVGNEGGPDGWQIRVEDYSEVN